MNSLMFLIPLALLLGGGALALFLWSLKSGQYDDLDGAAERIFLEEDDDRAGGSSAGSGHEPRAGEGAERRSPPSCPGT